MDFALAVKLLAEFGIPLTQQIIAWTHEGKTSMTPEDMAILAKLGQYRSSDALAAAGIAIVDGKVVNTTAGVVATN